MVDLPTYICYGILGLVPPWQWAGLNSPGRLNHTHFFHNMENWANELLCGMLHFSTTLKTRGMHAFEEDCAWFECNRACDWEQVVVSLSVSSMTVTNQELTPEIVCLAVSILHHLLPSWYPCIFCTQAYLNTQAYFNTHNTIVVPSSSSLSKHPGFLDVSFSVITLHWPPTWSIKTISVASHFQDLGTACAHNVHTLSVHCWRILVIKPEGYIQIHQMSRILQVENRIHAGYFKWRHNTLGVFIGRYMNWSHQKWEAGYIGGHHIEGYINRIHNAGYSGGHCVEGYINRIHLEVDAGYMEVNPIWCFYLKELAIFCSSTVYNAYFDVQQGDPLCCTVISYTHCCQPLCNMLASLLSAVQWCVLHSHHLGHHGSRY